MCAPTDAYIRQASAFSSKLRPQVYMYYSYPALGFSGWYPNTTTEVSPDSDPFMAASMQAWRALNVHALGF
jgi:hypothetical protein